MQKQITSILFGNFIPVPRLVSESTLRWVRRDCRYNIMYMVKGDNSWFLVDSHNKEYDIEDRDLNNMTNIADFLSFEEAVTSVGSR